MNVKNFIKFASFMYTNNKGEFKYLLFQCAFSGLNLENSKTFQPVVPVFLLPLVQQDVEVPRTLEET